jgi:hypothetical protein
MRRQQKKKKASSRYLASQRSLGSSHMYMSNASVLKKPFNAKDYIIFGCSERDVELYKEVNIF